MNQCVFEVQTRLKGEEYPSLLSWTSYKVIALTAEGAIKVAKKKMDPKEYVMTVNLIAELD